MPPDTFWELSPREIAAVLEGRAEALRREHNERAWLAWHTDALRRAKKLPKLKTLLAKEQRKPKAQSWQEQLAVAKAWHSIFSRNRKPNG